MNEERLESSDELFVKQPLICGSLFGVLMYRQHCRVVDVSTN